MGLNTLPAANGGIMKIRVGRYILFCAPVTVYIDTESGDGSGYLRWSPEGYGEIVVGIRGKSWPEAFHTLHHEVLEMAFLLGQAEFEPFTVLKDSSAGRFMFIADHAKFTVISQNAADMLCCAIPDFSTAFTKITKRKKRKGKTT